MDPLPEQLRDLKTRGKTFVKKHKKQIKRLSNDKAFDRSMQQAHHSAFEHIDCLECANCCKTTGPLFTNKDIDRIASHFNLRPGEFIDQYLRIDEDGDYVLKTVPCPFLGDDHYCSIYDIRPRACRQYPHTNQVGQKKILPLTLKNASICPAVLEALESIMVR